MSRDLDRTARRRLLPWATLRRCVTALLAVLLVGSGAVIAQAAASSASSAPSGGFGPIPYNGTEQSRCQGMSVASHVVFSGKDVVAQTHGGICGSAPKDVTWSWTLLPGAAISGCGKDATSCVFKAGASTDEQYTLICINGSNVQGAWQSCDYYGVVGTDMGVIDGYVTDRDGGPVAGTALSAYGAHGASTTSGADGYFAMQVEKGHYRVLPSGGPLGKSTPSYMPSVADVDVVDGSTAAASFQLQAGIELRLHFDKTSVPADGLQVVNGTLTTTEFGKPLGNVAVQLSVMPTETAEEALTKGPRAAICSAGSRVWPTGTFSTPDGYPVSVTTDAAGSYPFSVTVGTTPGSWQLDAWAKNSDGTLSTDTTAASDTQSIDFVAPAGSKTTLANFVLELNVAAKSTAFSKLLSSSANGLVSTLSEVTAAVTGGVRFVGLGYAMTNAKDGQSMLVFPDEKPPLLNSQGVIDPSLTRNADDLVLDPAEWTGTGLSAKVINATSLLSVMQAGALPDLPTLAEFDSGSAVKGWKTVHGDEVTPFSQSFDYLGWAYPGTTAGSCY